MECTEVCIICDGGVGDVQEDTLHYLFFYTSVLKGNKTEGMCGEEGRIKRGMNHLDRLCLDKIMRTVQYVLYCR